jgi:diguanylate cyclase (GGDEF)-like protein
LERATAGDQRLAVLFLDLDGFKHVNDSCGHDVGDALLVHVARMLQAAVRQTDVVARLGGDEFVVLLHDVSGPSMVAALADKIVRGVAQPCQVMGSRVQVGTSIGIALYPDDAPSREGLLKAADQAMYVAKTHGKGGYRFSSVGG